MNQEGNNTSKENKRRDVIESSYSTTSCLLSIGVLI